MSAVLQVRYASGRRVSLLNEEDVPPLSALPSPADFASFERQTTQSVSTPATPELFRANSYDSHRGTEPISPITPLYEPGYLYTPASGPEVRSPYDEYAAERRFSYETLERRPSYDGDKCTDIAPGSHQGNEQPVKRYPCRYREEFRCLRTFTTSGHASRHAKIHTSEKAVSCTYEGCSKKFTRADNMKQHLETHYKRRPRGPVSESLPHRNRRASSVRRRSLSPGPPSAMEGSAGRPARPQGPLQPYVEPRGLPLLPAPQVAEQPYYGQTLAADQAATTGLGVASPAMASPAMASPAATWLDTLASVALQQEEP